MPSLFCWKRASTFFFQARLWLFFVSFPLHVLWASYAPQKCLISSSLFLLLTLSFLSGKGQFFFVSSFYPRQIAGGPLIFLRSGHDFAFPHSNLEIRMFAWYDVGKACIAIMVIHRYWSNERNGYQWQTNVCCFKRPNKAIMHAHKPRLCFDCAYQLIQMNMERVYECFPFSKWKPEWRMEAGYIHHTLVTYIRKVQGFECEIVTSENMQTVFKMLALFIYVRTEILSSFIFYFFHFVW